MGRLKIKILGGARKVGASAILLDTGQRKILLDYGSTPSKNPEFPLPVDPLDIHAVVLTHAHIDHSGALPLLYKRAKGPMLFATPITIEYSDLLIRDMMKINNGKLPYTIYELEKMLEAAIPVRYNEPIEIDDDLVITLLNAGHVPGSASVLIETNGKKIWYTGDINTVETHLLEGADIVTDADIVIMESTYANRNHPERRKEEKRFVKAVKKVVKEGGVALIPSFSVGRSQEVMCILRHYRFKGKVALDGMAQTATSILLSYPEYIKDYKALKASVNRVKWMRTKSERKKMLKRPSAVISPAGMLSGGWAEWYLQRVYKKEENAIIFVSYQVPGTPGHRILNEKKIRINGKEKEVKAQVMYFDLSAHAGRKELLEIVSKFENAEKVIVVHGEEEDAVKFADELRDNYGFDAVAPELGEVIYIDV